MLGETMNVYSEGVSSFVLILDPTIQKEGKRASSGGGRRTGSNSY
jgi:hypothetical protein